MKLNKGITLIALIVTIIILLILAGVTITLLTEKGLFEKSKIAATKSKYIAAKEIIEVKLMEVKVDCINRNVECNLEEIAKNIKEDNEIIIEKYYTLNTSLIKEGIAEETINLTGIVVSTCQYQKYKFLIGDSCKLEGVTTKEITDTIKLEEFKTIDKFEEENFNITSNNNIKQTTEGKEVSYILKKDNLQNDIEMHNITYQDDSIGAIFNGSSSYVKINFDKKIEFPLTVELIILPLQDASKNQIFYFDSNTGTCIGNYNGEFVCSIGKNSYTREIPDDFYDGNIKDIIITYNSITDYELYINGEKTIKNSNKNYFTSSGRYLGCGPKGQYFKGKIYEFNIYNRILQEEEININYLYSKKYNNLK